jgi:hypothetical protein
MLDVVKNLGFVRTVDGDLVEIGPKAVAMGVGIGE